MPRGHEGADAAAAVAGDGSVVRIGAQFEAVLGLNGRQELLDEEFGVGGCDAVVFVAAIEARQGVLIRRRNDAGPDEEADEWRDFLLRDEIVEDDGGLVDKPILEDPEGGGLRLIESGGEADLILTLRAREDAAFHRGVGVVDHRALRHFWLRFGVGREQKLGLGGEGKLGEEKEGQDQAQAKQP
jgi:hypothetical protein